MATAKAYINAEILVWAREKIGYSPADLAIKMNVKEESILAWESGEAFPSFHQAINLAKKLRIPLGYLYLQEIPDSYIELPDFRTINNDLYTQYSFELLDTINSCRLKQNWYREYLISEGEEALDYVGSAKITEPIHTLAEKIRIQLGITDRLRKNAKAWDKFYDLLISQAENKGILILKNGVVDNNNYRALSVEEFRGFALVDDYAPLVFINNNDALSAQIFTLIHEIVHIWLGLPGVSGIDITKDQNEVEKYCNKVAAEVLVPGDEIKTIWDYEKSEKENLGKLSKHYRVSQPVILIKALQEKLIDTGSFKFLYPLITQKTKTATGGNAYFTYPIRSSKLFTRSLLTSVAEGKEMYREAARLLGVKVKTVAELSHRMDLT